MAALDQINPTFVWPPLKHDKNEIRLIEILQEDSKDPATDVIACRFLPPMSLDTPIEYEALSYTWGPKHWLAIQLDDQVFKITLSLFFSLRALEHIKAPRALWIDAICI